MMPHHQLFNNLIKHSKATGQTMIHPIFLLLFSLFCFLLHISLVPLWSHVVVQAYLTSKPETMLLMYFLSLIDSWITITFEVPPWIVRTQRTFQSLFNLSRRSWSKAGAIWRGPGSQALCSLSGGWTNHVPWNQHLHSPAPLSPHLQFPCHQCTVPTGNQV